MHCQWEYKLVKSLENNTEVPKKLEIELPHDPATPLLGVYPKKTKHEISPLQICVPLCSLLH